MKTKLILSNHSRSVEHWDDLPIIPRMKEWINVTDFIPNRELTELKFSANCWSGEKGVVDVVEYRKNNDGVYAELLVWCED